MFGVATARLEASTFLPHVDVIALSAVRVWNSEDRVLAGSTLRYRSNGHCLSKDAFRVKGLNVPEPRTVEQHILRACVTRHALRNLDNIEQVIACKGSFTCFSNI